MKYSTGLVAGAFIFAGSIALMGVLFFAVRDDRCPTDCRRVPRLSGTPCKYRQCYCKDVVGAECQPTKKTLSTAQRRTMRLLYSFTLVGLGILIFFSVCLCCRAESPTCHVNPPEGFPSMDTKVNFPHRGFRAYDCQPVTEMAFRY